MILFMVSLNSDSRFTDYNTSGSINLHPHERYIRADTVGFPFIFAGLKGELKSPHFGPFRLRAPPGTLDVIARYAKQVDHAVANPASNCRFESTDNAL
jgi:hypothetical protein